MTADPPMMTVTVGQPPVQLPWLVPPSALVILCEADTGVEEALTPTPDKLPERRTQGLAKLTAKVSSHLFLST